MAIWLLEEGTKTPHMLPKHEMMDFLHGIATPSTAGLAENAAVIIDE